MPSHPVRIDEASGQTPTDRLAERRAFYRRWGFCPTAPYGFGSSEVAFVEWLVRRGALHEKHGGPWWKAVQTALATTSNRAVESLEGPTQNPAYSPEIRAWRNYFAIPSHRCWFRAHNATVLAAALEHRDAAQLEPPEEQSLIRLILQRVLYAQALAEGATYWLQSVGPWLVAPHLPLIDKLLHSPIFYPDEYPVRNGNASSYRTFGFPALVWLTCTTEKQLISTQITHVIAAVAQWNDQRGLESLLARDGTLAYPNPGTFDGNLPSHPRIP